MKLILYCRYIKTDILIFPAYFLVGKELGWDCLSAWLRIDLTGRSASIISHFIQFQIPLRRPCAQSGVGGAASKGNVVL